MVEETKQFIKKFLETSEKIFKIIFGTKNNIMLKFKLSLPVSATLIYVFAIIFQEKTNPETAQVLIYISGILLLTCFVVVQNNSTIVDFLCEFIRLMIFFFILIFSLDFCVNTNLNIHGWRLILYSILACLGLFSCTFYFIAKFLDIYNFIKNLFKQIKERLFNSTSSSTSKLTALIENITALFVAIGGLALAIKAIIEPLINLFK